MEQEQEESEGPVERCEIQTSGEIRERRSKKAFQPPFRDILKFWILGKEFRDFLPSPGCPSKAEKGKIGGEKKYSEEKKLTV
jgi:hypothetical protein